MAHKAAARRPDIPGTEYVSREAPLERPAKGRKVAMTGAVFTMVGVVLSVVASLLSAIVLVRVQLASPYSTVQEALDAGQGGDYIVPFVAAGSQILWILIVLIGFCMLAIGLVRGYRRPWVWAAAVAGPLGLIFSGAIFLVALGVTASG